MEKFPGQNPRKDIMQLKRQRKKLCTQYQNTENVYEKTVTIEWIKIIKEHITDKIIENRSRRIIKVAQKIKSNVDSGGKIWEIKQKLQKKMKQPIISKMKKQQNRMFIPDFREVQEVLWKPTTNQTVRDSWRNTDTV